ncbi:MAG: aldo/keto reductase [Gammaproteobacteria bacterium]|nr:aldo/keto reductase [Gammaproteobacteria bacterium]
MTAETIKIAGIPRPVSRVALGTWAIGGSMWGGTDEPASIATIQSAIDRGINLIDTAPVYGFGRSEEIIGKALHGARRDKAMIATKLGLRWDDGKVTRDASPARIRQEVEDSLRRLQTDHIDLYQVHWPDGGVPLEETAAELEKLRHEGKILSIGVSNFSTHQMDCFRKAAPLASVQPPYNLFERDIDDDVLPYADSHGLAVLAYGSLCRGLLSGRIGVDTVFEGDDLRRNDPKFKSPRRAHYVDAVRALDAWARHKHGKSVLALAVRWVLDRGPTIALWGARRPDQLEAVCEVFNWRLEPDEMREIDAIVMRHVADPVGPEFMAPPERKAA